MTATVPIHDSDTLADVKAREEAAIGLLVHYLLRQAADPYGGLQQMHRTEIADLRRQVHAEVMAHVTAPDDDDFIAECRRVGKGWLF